MPARRCAEQPEAPTREGMSTRSPDRMRADSADRWQVQAAIVGAVEQCLGGRAIQARAALRIPVLVPVKVPVKVPVNRLWMGSGRVVARSGRVARSA